MSWRRSLPLRLLVPLLVSAPLGIALVWLLWFAPSPGPATAIDGLNEAGSATPPGDSAHRVLDLAAPPQGGEFQLRGPHGPVRLSDLRGRVVLLYFGYTLCPDICPTNLALIALALRGLTPAEVARVQVVFVSVDPARDTPARLAEYTAWFHPGILGLTGSADELAAAGARYGAAWRRVEQADSALGYAVDHSAYTYVIDPAGRLVETLDHATPAEDIAAAIRRHLGPG